MWTGRTVLIAASGPSLAGQLDAIRERPKSWALLVVNSTWEALPDADALYAGDLEWWEQYHEKVAAGFRGERWTRSREASERYGARHADVMGASRVHVPSSGLQAIAFAHLRGSRRLVLAGFDMRAGRDGEKHHHADHPAPLMQEQMFSRWLRYAVPLANALKARGCDVVNCTARTAMTCFRRSSLASAYLSE